MFTPKTKMEYENFLVENFENIKVLVFLSNSVKLSNNYEKILSEMSEDFEDNDISVLLIKDENKELNYLFSEYEINFAPYIIILNTNLNVLKKFNNISPGELLIKIEELENVFNINQNLEQEKYSRSFEKLLTNDIFILFDFGNYDFTKIKDYFKNHNIPYLNLTPEMFNEKKILTILCNLQNYLTEDFVFDINNPVLVFFNKNVFKNEKNIILYIDENKALIENLKSNKDKEFNDFLKKNVLVLFLNKECKNWKNQEKILNFLKEKNIIFSFLDISKNKNSQNFLQKKLNKKNMEYPILKIKNSYKDDINKKENDFENNKEGEFKNIIELIPKDLILNSVDDLIKHLISSNKIIVFMKGSPGAAQCGFSNKMVEYLESREVKYAHFNIMNNEQLRNRLKILYNWNTFPQLYINGKLIGGNDVVQQLDEIGEMDNLLYK